MPPAAMDDLDRIAVFLRTGLDPGGHLPGTRYDAVRPRTDKAADTLFRQHKVMDEVVLAMVAGGRGADLVEAAVGVLRDSPHGHHRRRGHAFYLLAKLLCVRQKTHLEPAETPPGRLRVEEGEQNERRLAEAGSLARRRVLEVLDRTKSGEEMLRLFYFIHRCGKVDPAVGLGGSGNRRLLSKWFNGMDYVALASIENKVFSVRDLVRIGHVKGHDDDHKVMATYFARGYEKVPRNKGLNRFAPAMSYLACVRKLKNSARDPIEAARVVRENFVSPKLIPTEVLYDPEVLKLRIQRGSVRDLLELLPALTRRRGVLTGAPEDEVALLVASALRKEWDLSGCGVLPAELLVARRKVTVPRGKPKHEHPKRRRRSAKARPAAPEAIVSALENALALSFKNLPPLRCRSVLVWLDNRKLSQEMTRCFGEAFLTVADAMVVTVMSLVKSSQAGAADGGDDVEAVTVATLVGDRDSDPTLSYRRGDPEERWRERLRAALADGATGGKGIKDGDAARARLGRVLDQRPQADAVVFLLAGDHPELPGAVGPLLGAVRKQINPAARAVYCNLAEDKFPEGAAPLDPGPPPERRDLAVKGFDCCVPSLIIEFCNKLF